MLLSLYIPSIALGAVKDLADNLTPSKLIALQIDLCTLPADLIPSDDLKTFSQVMQMTVEQSPRLIRPSEFRRERRPHLYSDSVSEPLPPMDRPQFEFYLDQITTRKDESRFERFVRALIEETLCPNLLPQTGPTGGGDSKVDSETYPVADAIAMRWYWGAPREASEERWAFAISAKRGWRGKLKSDIENILTTGINYKRIYFVSNQAISDKKRAIAEKQESKTARCDVRIFDRTWIVEKIFEGRFNRWSLVEDSFGLQGLAHKYQPRLGPRDAKATAELEAIDAELRSSKRFEQAPHQMVEAWLSSAYLARRLQRSKDELEGRFAKAIEIASGVDAKRILSRAYYELACTRYWWYDDPNGVLDPYDSIESGFSDNVNSFDVERLTSLYMLLAAAVRQKQLPASKVKLPDRARRLDALVGRLAQRRSQPTDAAWAQTQRFVREAADAIDDPISFDAALESIHALIPELQRLIEYPLMDLSRFVEALGEAPRLSAAYEKLADQVTTIVQQRVGEDAAVSALIKRAENAVRSDRPYDAIRLLGRAWEKLNRQEARDDHIRGSALAAEAFESIGLLWAARAHLVLAVERAFQLFEEDGRLDSRLLYLLHQMTSIEVKLGRIPAAIQLYRLVENVAIGLGFDGDSETPFGAALIDLHSMLGLLVLRSTEQDIPALESAPFVLRREGMPIAEDIVLHILGDEDATNRIDHMIEGGASSLLSNTEYKALPLPSWGYAERQTYSTRVLGCLLTCDIPNKVEAIAISEALLGIIEAFLSTASMDRLYPAIEAFVVILNEDSDPTPLSATILEDEYGEFTMRIRYGPDVANAAESITIDPDCFVSIAAQILTHVCLMPLVNLERMSKEDRVIARSFGLLNSISATVSLLGWSKRLTWQALSLNAEIRPYSRQHWWHDSTNEATAEIMHEEPNGDHHRLSFAEGPEPQVSHQLLRIQGLIKPHLWDRAGWRAVGFETYGDPEEIRKLPPLLMLVFDDREAATKIQRGLIRRIGNKDVENLLRLCFITGINEDHPNHYRVSFGPGEAMKGMSDGKLMLMMNRLHTMEVESTANLDRFWDDFSAIGWCFLGMASFSSGMERPQMVELEPIALRCIVRKEAWEIGPDDLDQMAILSEDRPIIPADVLRPPVSELQVARKNFLAR